MYKINFEKPIHIHFIGIGGISMSGLAEILLEEGFTVSGSDSKESPLTKKLESEGAIILTDSVPKTFLTELTVLYTLLRSIKLIQSLWKLLPARFQCLHAQSCLDS